MGDLRRGSPGLRGAVSVEHMPDFEGLVEKKHAKYFVKTFYVDYMMK